MKSRKKGLIDYLRIRELGLCASMPRNDYRLFTNLVMSDNRVYQKKDEFRSSCPIFFEADRIYTNHYRQAYSVVKRNLVYDLDRSTILQTASKERIVNADIFYLTSAPTPADILCSELFVGLTDLHRLLLLDARTGQLLKTFQLPFKENGYKFSELGIGKDNETLYVKGRLLQIQSATRQPHFVFAIFNLAPVRFQCMFVVSEAVLGPFVNVMISQDLMVFSHSGSLLKFYSLEDVLYKARQVESEADQTGVLRVNVTIDWPCPCLYEVRVTGDALEMGGFPWHCLYKAPKETTYRLQALASGRMVTLGKDQLRQTDPGQGMEVNVFFAPDEGGSILHVTETELKKLLIVEREEEERSDPSRRLEEAWTFSIISAPTEEAAVVTSSGRRTSRAHRSYSDCLQYIHCVQYSSSMEALCVVVYDETTMSDKAGGRASLLLVDSQHGKLIKTIRLDEPWDDLSEEHHIELDDDILIHTIKHRSGKHSCHVYRLSEAISGDSGGRARSKRKSAQNRRRPKRRRRDSSDDEDGDRERTRSNVGTDREYSLRRNR